MVDESPDEIQGLIGITDAGDHLFLPLVEAAPQNFGQNKKYYGVLGNLTAFACRLSFEKGYNGEVAFVAKTALIPHCQQQLGATLLGGTRMAILTAAARKIVSLYFKDFRP